MTAPFLATETRSIRNPQTGRVSQIVKGQYYSKSQIKAFIKNGMIPEFIVDGKISHFERFVPRHEALLKSHGYVSDSYLAVCRGIIDYHGGDSKALRRFALGGGTAQMAMRLEREFGELLELEYVDLPHGADDPLAETEHTWDGCYVCTKNQEDVIIGMTVQYLTKRYS